MGHGEPECVWPVAAELGEGPVVSDGAVWFCDIRQSRIHRFDIEKMSGQSWNAPVAPGFLAPAGGGKFLLGARAGLHVFDPPNREFLYLRAVEPEWRENRLNDGIVDARGRLWFGSMDDREEQATGRLYRFDHRGLKAMDHGYVITNGPVISPDGRKLYHTDTLAKVIHVFDLDDEGALSNKRVFVRIEDGAGFPDGPTVDAEGCLWTGLFGGWAARRYSPEGVLLTVVKFPVANVTKLAFDQTTAYATTAWKGLDESERRAQPLAGGLFRFAVETPGLPQPILASV